MNRKTTIAVSVVLLLAGVGLATPHLAERPPLFSHAAHLKEGPDCKDCHAQSDTAGLPQLDPESCKNCHDNPMTWSLKARHGRLKAAFPHRKHADAADCKDCHQATVTETGKTGKTVLGYTDCVSCHEKNGLTLAGGNCAACHGSNVRQQKPSDHDAGWTARHGHEARWRVFDRHGMDCSTCHRSDACTSCHATSKPRNHTALWRIRTHGFAAEFDSESCKTCHETGSCVQCHKETVPLSHKGAWKSLHGTAAGSGSAQQCAVCHGPTDCASCHR